MVLSESNNIAYGGNNKPNSPNLHQPLLQEEPLKISSFSPLSGQNSLLSLTLNEIKHKSGKNFGSMNMDEFLANLWSSVDENNLVTSQPNNQNQNQNQNNCKDNNANNNTDVVSPTTLARQGSFSIPTPLGKKTVDEVWFEIQKDQPDAQNPNNNINGAHEPPQRQQTLGEMTLEDFLVKAGVVQESHVGSSSQQKMLTPMQNLSTCLDESLGMGQVMGIGFSAHQTIGNSFSTSNGFTQYQMFPQTTTNNKGFVGEAPNATSQEQGTFELVAQQNKKRVINGLLEVVVERRQRRMIKNRESAARSRARKQAYTVELELELNQLKEENTKLTQLVEEIEQSRKEEVLRRKPPTMLQRKAEKLKSIRRTMSA